MKISFIIGTRPELIKVAPLIWQAKVRNIEFDVVNTAQHKDLLVPYWKTFDVKPTHTLDVMLEGQNLSSLTSRAISQIQEYINSVEKKPTIILAQGDTTSVMAAAMVSFFNKIKFAHLEAGLRSFNLDHPFPEEYNRRIAGIAADFHLCPTYISKNNLLNEGISDKNIFVVGNTVVDTLNKISTHSNFINSAWANKNLDIIENYKKCVLITCHRRENQGENLKEIIESILELSIKNLETLFVWTLHPNPNIRDVVINSPLNLRKNVLLTEPLEYSDLLKILKISICAISDSGGIQEEAPSFKTPVLVLRETTERPEGVDAGMAFLVGSDKTKIISKFNQIKNSSINFKQNPYGDGKSSKYIFDILLNNNL